MYRREFFPGEPYLVLSTGNGPRAGCATSLRGLIPHAGGAHGADAAKLRVAEEGPACSVETITSYQRFLEIEPLWNALVDEANADNPFVRHEWVRSWWECFGEGHELNILLIRARHEPIGIIPLARCKRRMCGVPVRQLQFIWNVYAERCDCIVRHGCEAAYQATIEHLLEQRDWEVLLLPQLAAHSSCLAELPRIAAGRGMRIGLRRSVDSPYVPLAGTWDSYCAGLERKHRANLRNREKRLRTLGTVTLELVSSPEGLAAALRDGFDLEAAGWKGRAGTAIAANPEAEQFFTRLAREAATQGSLRLYFLALDGVRIAFAYYLEYGRKLCLLKPGYNPEFSRFSPSNILCYFVLRDAYQRGLAEVDFLAAADPWKLRWTKHLRSHYWLYIFPNRPEPRLLHWLKFCLRPRLAREPRLRAWRDTAARTLATAQRLSGLRSSSPQDGAAKDMAQTTDEDEAQ